jgi:hypothetical protein
MIVFIKRQRIIKRVHAERSGADYGEITIAGTSVKNNYIMKKLKQNTICNSFYSIFMCFTILENYEPILTFLETQN